MFFDGEKKTASVRTHHLKTARGIWRTNAVADGASGYVYETVSRCNHACADANARRAFRKDGVCALIATAPIAAGSEVLVDYGVGDRAPARATEQELVLCIVLQADGAGVPTPRQSAGPRPRSGGLDARRPSAARGSAARTAFPARATRAARTTRPLRRRLPSKGSSPTRTTCERSVCF